MGNHSYRTRDTTLYALDRIGDSLLSFAGKTAYAHWRDLSHGDRLPDQEQFLGKALGGFEQLFAICTVCEYTPRIQYWGRFLEKWLGPRQVGEPLLAAYADTLLTDRLGLIMHAISSSSVGRVVASSREPNSWDSLEEVYLPLSNNEAGQTEFAFIVSPIRINERSTKPTSEMIRKRSICSTLFSIEGPTH